MSDPKDIAFAHEWDRSEWHKKDDYTHTQLRCKHCKEFVAVPQMKNTCPARIVVPRHKCAPHPSVASFGYPFICLFCRTARYSEHECPGYKCKADYGEGFKKPGEPERLTVSAPVTSGCAYIDLGPTLMRMREIADERIGKAEIYSVGLDAPSTIYSIVPGDKA